MGSTIVRLGFVTAAATLMTMTAACSSAATTASTAGPASSAPTSITELSDTPAPGDHDAFTACLTEHGVPAPPDGGPGHGPGGPGGPGGQPPAGPPPSGAPQPGQGGTPPAPPGVDQGTWDTAMQACKSLAPAPPQR